MSLSYEMSVFIHSFNSMTFANRNAGAELANALVAYQLIETNGSEIIWN